MANATPIVLGTIAVFLISRLLRREPTAQQTPPPSHTQPPTDSKLIWPIDEQQIQRHGDSVMDKRPSSGKPHKGIDIFAPSRTLVRSVVAGSVVRVEDGRASASESSKAAGLWVDIKGSDSLIYRYLHLGLSYVRANDAVTQGTPIGYIAEANTSGLGNEPHLHFEIRQGDYTKLRADYGAPIDPLTQLPQIRR